MRSFGTWMLALLAGILSCAGLPDAPLAPEQLRQRIERLVLAATAGQRSYIRVEKPLVQPGESIRFRVDLVRASDFAGVQAKGTVVLHDGRGNEVARRDIGLLQGVGAGEIELARDARGGPYDLELQIAGKRVDGRALSVASYEAPRFTKRLELDAASYGAGDRVVATIDLARATGEPLSRRGLEALVEVGGSDRRRLPFVTDARGHAAFDFRLPAELATSDATVTVVVSDGGVSESVQRAIPIVRDVRMVAFYPEGGDLVVGLSSRVFYAVFGADGRPASIEADVVDDRGTRVAALLPHRNGLGSFELTPAAGRHYRVTMDGREFPVPDALDTGCVLRADAGDAVRARLACTAPADLYLTALVRGVRMDGRALHVEPGAPVTVEIPSDRAPNGIVRLSVWDGRGRVAERLVYHGLGRDLRVTVTPDRSRYAPRDRVNLTVRTTTAAGVPVPASLSLAVVDDAVLSLARRGEPGLLAKLYLEPDIGPLDEADEADAMLAGRADAKPLDELVATRGWRKGRLEGPVTYERGGTTMTGNIVGHVTDLQSAQPILLVTVVASSPALKGQQSEFTDQDGNYTLADLPPGRYSLLFIYGDVKVKRDDVLVVRSFAARVDERMDIDQADPIVIREQVPAINMEATSEPMVFDRGFGRLAPDLSRSSGHAAPRPDPFAAGFASLGTVTPRPRPDGDTVPRSDLRETVYWNPTVTTDASGRARVTFALDDRVTSFRAIAEGLGGGLPGRGEATLASKLSLFIDAKPPLEVSAGDRIDLPVTIANEVDRPIVATVGARLGAGLELAQPLPGALTLGVGERRTLTVPIDVVGARATEAEAIFVVAGGGFRDEVVRRIRIEPPGFPQEVTATRVARSGATARAALAFDSSVAGSLDAEVRVLSTPVAMLIDGAKGLIRRPTGCFEQTSARNYPNVMVQAYLSAHDVKLPLAQAEELHQFLADGYARLVGFEVPGGGFDWFGRAPASEALTAYGLVEFVDMQRVFPVSDDLIARTAAWLLSRRDGRGGYLREEKFGSHSAEVDDTYISWALVEAGHTAEMPRELEAVRQRGRESGDPYVVALAASTLPADRDIAARLAGMQAPDGSFPGAATSTTHSGGHSLLVETTALAALALLKAPAGLHDDRVRRAIDWLNDARDGLGVFGSTQGTVLALKALTAWAQHVGVARAAGKATLTVNGATIGALAFESGDRESLIWRGLAPYVHPGANTIELRLDADSEIAMPFVIAGRSRVDRAPSSPRARVKLTTRLSQQRLEMGEPVRLHASVANVDANVTIPMTLVRIGIPGGLTIQPAQLDELKARNIIDFYETGRREVILYFKDLPAGAHRELDIDLIAGSPGRYTAPPSVAYLYYTDEDKSWAAPLAVTVAAGR